MTATFVIHEATKLQYAALFVLKEMHEQTYVFHTQLEEGEEVLDPILEWLLERQYIYYVESG